MRASSLNHFSQDDPKKNRLLAALAEQEWQRLQPQLEFINLPLKHVLYELCKTLS